MTWSRNPKRPDLSAPHDAIGRKRRAAGERRLADITTTQYLDRMAVLRSAVRRQAWRKRWGVS